ncbi:MAG: hypothetical protein K9J83_08375 [Desulfarculaceae bacterium]|nr:hypothetical protein [Desulfarculaceae bacterium]
MSSHKVRQMMKAEKERARLRFKKHIRKNMFARPGANDFVIVLDNLKPTFNVGKIFRSADVFGAKEVHLVGIDFFDPASGKGALKWVPAKFFDTFDDSYARLVQMGYTVFILEPGTGYPVQKAELPEKSAFVLGHEAFGITFDPDGYDRVERLKIPQFGRSQSLNVSVAASVVMYEYVRRWGKEQEG